MTYTPLRPDQMENVALDMSLDEDTSSMDEIPQKCPLKPQKKTKGNRFSHLFIRAKKLLVATIQSVRRLHGLVVPSHMLLLKLNHSAKAPSSASLLSNHNP